nr:polynucleotidyl transferase, ribonuclease H-like superfamily protein [Tanacetum cinerariifolium]
MVKVKNEFLISWVAPPVSWVVLNTDGASRGNPGDAGGGGILRDAQGYFICAFAENYGICTMMSAEILALLQGILMARDARIKKLIIKHLDIFRFLALGWHLEEIHVTWANLKKKWTRLRTCTKIHEEVLITERGDGVAGIKRRRRDLSGDSDPSPHGRILLLVSLLNSFYREDDPKDFAKPVKAITLPQDVMSTSNCHLIELENQVQHLMEAYLAPMQPTQVNRITTPYEIYSGPHDTQYCIKDPEQAFVEYTSSLTDETGSGQFSTNQGPRSFNEATNSWKEKPNFNWAHAHTFTVKPPNRVVAKCRSESVTS